MKKSQLLKFVKTRNKSPHSSNLQVWFDAEAAGFKVEDLGPATKHDEGHYTWQTPHGTLTEKFGQWNLTE